MISHEERMVQYNTSDLQLYYCRTTESTSVNGAVRPIKDKDGSDTVDDASSASSLTGSVMKHREV